METSECVAYLKEHSLCHEDRKTQEWKQRENWVDAFDFVITDKFIFSGFHFQRPSTSSHPPSSTSLLLRPLQQNFDLEFSAIHWPGHFSHSSLPPRIFSVLSMAKRRHHHTHSLPSIGNSFALFPLQGACQQSPRLVKPNCLPALCLLPNWWTLKKKYTLCCPTLNSRAWISNGTHHDGQTYSTPIASLLLQSPKLLCHT